MSRVFARLVVLAVSSIFLWQHENTSGSVMAGLMFERKVKGRRWFSRQRDHHRGRLHCPGCSM